MCHNYNVTFMSNIITYQYAEFILSNQAVKRKNTLSIMAELESKVG